MYVIQTQNNDGSWYTDPVWRETYQTDLAKAIAICERYADTSNIRVCEMVPVREWVYRP